MPLLWSSVDVPDPSPVGRQNSLSSAKTGRSRAHSRRSSQSFASLRLALTLRR